MQVRRRFPIWDRVFLAGFSLGANVIVNFLGQEVSVTEVTRTSGVYCTLLQCDFSRLSPLQQIVFLAWRQCYRHLFGPGGQSLK